MTTQEPDTETEWNIKPKSPLDNFVKERGEDIIIWEDIEDVFYKRDKLTISVSYIKCVKLDEIEEQKPWSQRRRDDVGKWATPYTLCLTENKYLPVLERQYNLNSDKTKKFKIVDGIHRINRAKELGMECIRAKVTDEVKVNKTDTKNIELKTK